MWMSVTVAVVLIGRVEGRRTQQRQNAGTSWQQCPTKVAQNFTWNSPTNKRLTTKIERIREFGNTTSECKECRWEEVDKVSRLSKTHIYIIPQRISNAQQVK